MDPATWFARAWFSCFSVLVSHGRPLLQASQLGVYRAFVDNYEAAVETAERCCQVNAQFAEISEVS